MKNILILVCFFAISISLFAQKNDYNWILGNIYSPECGPFHDLNNPGTKISFLFPTLSITNTKSAGLEDRIAVMSDANGNYLYNGTMCGYYDEQVQTIIPIDSLRHPVKDSLIFYLEAFHEALGQFCTGNASHFSEFSIPSPKAENVYYVFYYVVREHIYIHGLTGKSCYTKVDYSNPDAPKSERGYTLFQDTLFGFNACKHANGRDWWLLGFGKHRQIYRSLLTDKGIEPQSTQYLTDGFFPFSMNEQSEFSPDGSKFAMGQVAGISLWDFDRCNGFLSNPIKMAYDSCNSGGSLAYGQPPYDEFTRPVFSPNGRFLYTTMQYEGCTSTGHHKEVEGKVIQYDLWENGFPNKGDTVAFAGHHIAPWLDPINVGQLLESKPTRFFGGPDGKIYGGSYPNYIDVIESPNKKGIACDVRLRKHAVNTGTHGSWPRFPRYRLGPLDGTACDTLGLNNNPLCGWRHDLIDTTARKVEFTDNSFYEPATWYWDFGDGTTSLDTSPVHIFPADGVYNVCLTVCNQYSCDTLCQNVSIGVTATETPQSVDDLFIYPNPASYNLTISLPQFTSFETQILQLINPLGQILQSQTITGGQAEIDVSRLPAGLIFVQILDNGKIRAVGKVLIQH